MKFSEAWLREWVNPQIDSNALCEQVTMAGLEVDEVSPVAGSFSGVIVGEVVHCEQHPDADKLRVTQVNVGNDELISIVCGAPNCRQGLKVAVAMVGAILPGDFKIKKAKLRGQPSFGMLCSARELEISDDHDGIIELAVDAPVGKDLRDYLMLNDQSIDIDLTPNRADCLSIAGVAREVGVLNNIDVIEPEISGVDSKSARQVGVVVSAKDACPRYLGRVIEGIDMTATTPLWMAEKLRRGGIRSIDPIVDITNYILLELGQPLHAFDADKLSGGIDIRLAKNGEKLVTLDEQTIELSDNTLVIADQKGPIALAGIFGGQATGISEKTTTIFLESAFFSPLAITGRARQYGLHTDASHRFERGVDWQLQERALDRASGLILAICGGLAGDVNVAEAPEHLPKPQSIILRHSRLERFIGQAFERTQVTEILTRLGLHVVEIDSGWNVVAPSYRFDLEIEQDLIEEVARIYGYNSIPNKAPVAHLTMSAVPESKLSLSRLRHILVDRDYQEAITYSFVDPKKQQLLHPQQETMDLPNPISSDMSQMRLSLWTGLLDVLSYNQKRQQSRIRLFETGLRFVPDRSSPLNVRQEQMVAGVICGLSSAENWHGNTRDVDFFDVKGDVEVLIASTGCSAEFDFVKAENPALHPGQSAKILRNNETVGWIGAIHPKFEKTFGLSGRVFLFELTAEALTQAVIPQAKLVSKFPANRRDIAIVVEQSINAADLIKSVWKNGTNQLVGVNLFDVYQGKGVTEGKKSIALSLTLQDTSHTLEEGEIVTIVDNIVAALKSEFDASLRD
ncbi:phenylalanine--tRNA ligase subunit beta [Celerinatantimonas yamalensis]|uniref:Phenylalanine--tRNA ligase beta subunit n=1 Tax=Celerinatantimonas yamalensis TaxID=559956 RepID=A0ABW9G335_9GAMM